MLDISCCIIFAGIGELPKEDYHSVRNRTWKSTKILGTERAVEKWEERRIPPSVTGF